MFEFNRLPTLVKKQIVCYAVDALYGKERLKLWSISPEWQELVLPNLFRSVVLVENQDSHESMVDTKGYWSSDLERLGRLQCARYVRRVVIVIQTIDGFCRFAREFCSLFETDANVWIRVLTLEVYVKTDLESGLRLEDHFTENYQSLRHTANKLADDMITCMPSITKLLLSTGTDDSCASLLCSRLGNSYSNQLKTLVSVSRFTFDYLGSFPCLTVLEVQLDSSAAQLLPVVNTALLQYVRISNATRKFSWDSFAMTDQHVVCFGNLESATIDFIQNDETLADRKYPDEIPQILLPKLDHLIISDCPPDHRIFDNCVLPRQLKTVIVFNSFEVLEHLSQMTILGSADEIYVDLSVSVPEDRLCPVLNQCYGAAATCRDSQLHINFATHLNFAVLDLSTLKSFGISLLHFADLLDIVTNIPGLVWLSIATLDFEDEMPNGQRFDFAEYLQMPVRPLNSKLQDLNIRRFAGQPIDVASVFVQHLAMSLKMLNSFESLEDVNADFRRFVLEYKDEYPHLANITIGHPDDVNSEDDE